jgi:uncharacterized RDD family membrane protein YckC
MAAPATTPNVLNDEPAVANDYAGLVTRAVALAIDAVIVEGSLLLIGALFSLIAALVGGVEFSTAAKVISAAGWVLVTAGYFVIGWSAAGQTIGMRVMELSVLTEDTLLPPGFWRSVLRVILLAVCILLLFIGFIPVLFDARRRGVHDMVARTVVLHADAVP